MKKVFAVLLIAVCALSFVCFKQHKKIENIESDIASLEDSVYTLEDKVRTLKGENEYLVYSISSLQEEMEEHFPRPQKTFAEKRQDYIDEINRFNAAREQEEKQGIKNTDKRINGLREWYRFIKKTYNIDIEIK